MTTCRVLSIQSHVVSGYVGNKSVTFPLQLLGFEVDAINSVQFSNHTGYPCCKGQVLEAAQLGELYEGLKANDLNYYTHLLTGYIGSESFLKKVKDVILDLKKKNPNLVYVCDPVMGDNGKMYVAKELLPIYQEEIIPLADVITPNQYEAEVLSGITIDNAESAKQAMKKLHKMGAKTVIVSSSDLGEPGILVGFGSSVTNGNSAAIKVEMAQIPMYFTGTGDLFAAMILVWLHRHPDDLPVYTFNMSFASCRAYICISRMKFHQMGG